MEKLKQGQVWKVGEDFYRIVKWQRLAIEYKHITDWETREGTVHTASKKEFCRLIRSGQLYQPLTDAEGGESIEEDPIEGEPSLEEPIVGDSVEGE